MPTLNWLARDSDLAAAGKVPFRLLTEEPALSFGAGDNGLLVQGDNLDALKALLPFYAGKVKCIYIDPPYNTRSAFEHYDDNLEHAQWLGMIAPRLMLLREFLSEDGSIWVSIDDNEGHYLKVVMDEVFGRRNFLTDFIWQKSYGGGAKARWFVGLHETIHCYAKNIEMFPDMFLPPDPQVAQKYYKLKDTNFDKRGPYRLQPLATTSNDFRANLVYPITAPDGREILPEKQWQWSRDRVADSLSRGEIVFSPRTDGRTTVSYKQYLRDATGEERRRKPKSIITDYYTQRGSQESREMFGLEEKFSFPKPEGLVWSVIEACTNPGDLVLDSFLGSGTTAAVAHKMGRRWIGIEMGDHARTHCATRLRKVIEGEQGGISKDVGWQGGGGFRFMTLGPAIYDAQGRIADGVRFADLARHVWFVETRTPPDRIPDHPLIGITPGEPPRAVALLYNGILKDRSAQGGNVLTRATLALIREGLPGGFDGPLIVYATAARLSPATLKAEGVIFRQTPYELNAGAV